MLTYNSVVVRLRRAFLFENGSLIFFCFEPLGEFDSPLAQTKGPVKKYNPSYLLFDPLFCGTVRAFSRLFPQLLLQTALLTRIVEF